MSKINESIYKYYVSSLQRNLISKIWDPYMHLVLVHHFQTLIGENIRYTSKCTTNADIFF